MLTHSDIEMFTGYGQECRYGYLNGSQPASKALWSNSE